MFVKPLWASGPAAVTGFPRRPLPRRKHAGDLVFQRSRFSKMSLFILNIWIGKIFYIIVKQF
jgi:hypothetical protein